MNKPISIERLDCLLQSHPGIGEVYKNSVGNELFQRARAFQVRGFMYQIVWWSNMSYLHVGEVVIPFTDLQIHGNWPNAFKLNLHFYDNGNTCAIIPLESYLSRGTVLGKQVAPSVH